MKNKTMNDIVMEEFLKTNLAKDPLTGLFNRESFNFKASQRVHSDEDDLAIIWFNISNFKKYNNRFGFEGGNILLCELGEILCEVFYTKSKNRDVVSRFSDDNFIVLTDKNGIEERISFTEKYLYSLHPNIILKIRAGIYFSSKNDDINEACDKAKMACDSIRKNHSLNFSVYKEEMGKGMELEHYILDVFDDALKKGNIKVFYQPIIRILTGSICETEALVRWKNDVLGFISPGDFVPVLEQYHEINRLDIYAVQQVCRDYKKRKDQGLPILPVSVNLSRLDFELCDIFEEIDKAVTSNEMPHDMIKIEITESVHGEDMTALNLGIEKFRANGYEVWMDDFGSGYSSLNVLKDYNFDTIKFDMKFLSGFGENSDKARYILSSNLSMAKQMGTQSLCEGVENIEQLEYLRTIGFEKAQGYYFGKPMSLDDIFELKLPIEDFRDAPYYEKLGKIEIPDQDVMNHAGTVIADVRAFAIIEKKDNKISLLTKNRTYKEWLDSLDKESKEFLKNYLLEIINREIKKDFYILSNGNLLKTTVRPYAENLRTGAEAWVIAQRELTNFSEADKSAFSSAVKRASFYKIFEEIYDGEFLRLD